MNILDGTEVTGTLPQQLDPVGKPRYAATRRCLQEEMHSRNEWRIAYFSQKDRNIGKQRPD